MWFWNPTEKKEEQEKKKHLYLRNDAHLGWNTDSSNGSASKYKFCNPQNQGFAMRLRLNKYLYFLFDFCKK